MSGSVTLGEYALRDIDVAAIAGTFNTMTVAGRDQLIARLSDPIADPIELQKRQAHVRSIRTACKTADVRTEIEAARAVLRDTEEDIRAVLDAKNDKRHAEYYNQVMWAPDSIAAFLNERGWITELVIFFRTLFLPGMSVLMPLAILLMPMLLFRYVLKQPLTMEGYFKMITTALKKAMPSVLGKPHFAGRGGAMELGEQVVHLGVSAAVFVGSIWSQISAARALRGVVGDMRRRAASVRAAAAAIGRLERTLGLEEAANMPSWHISDLGLFGQVWNTPATAQRLLDRAGELDMFVAVALQKRVCFSRYGDRVALTDLYHPGAGPHGSRVLNSISMGGSVQRNILLTGPNRGGKSTLLKSLGAAVLMSQTVGVVFARRAVLPVFDAIITALQPTDKLGKMSLFEAEIEFAKGVKSVLAGGPTTFLMMDEIFHGTNAHDGVEASQVFLDELYETSAPLFSIVSTHYMGLPERYGPGSGTKVAQTLCMDAATDPADPDRLIYTYKLKEGVNQLSSVREILRERGLLTTKTVCVALASEKSVVSASKA
jgi:energy-coupling factor transporter ATP-binding protein EcfA2